MSKGPLVVVTSYTKFDNLAHSPEGIEAKQCIRTFRLDPSSGQLTLVSVYTDCEDRYFLIIEVESSKMNNISFHSDLILI